MEPQRHLHQRPCIAQPIHPPNSLGPACLQDPRVERLPCSHSGTYADDCICDRVKQHRCYIVATCDKDLRRRLRKAGGWVHRACRWISDEEEACYGKRTGAVKKA